MQRHTFTLQDICNGQDAFTFDRIIARTGNKELTARVFINSDGSTFIRFQVIGDSITDHLDTSDFNEAMLHYNSL